MRTAGLTLVLAAVLLGAAWPSAAGAYELGGQKWPKRTITYRDGGINRVAVRMAARAWSRSGARIRFKAVRRGRADVLVRRQRRGLCGGYAQLGYSRHTQATMYLAKCADRSIAAVVAAHELGHILGINHENRRCATMNPVVTGACRYPKAFWARCRLLQRDDVRAAVRRYGGRVKPLGADFCPRFAAPSPPTGLALAVDPQSTTITASFTVPRPRMLIPGSGYAPWADVAVHRYANACPGGPPTGTPLSTTTASARRETLEIDDRLEAGPGRHCYAFWVTDATGRRAARAATATVDVRVRGPRAVLDLPDPAIAGEDVYFSHSSEPGEAGIESERWTFGDNTPSSANPYHTYGAPGSYTVTLTVTDRYGQASSASRQITVTA